MCFYLFIKLIMYKCTYIIAFSLQILTKKIIFYNNFKCINYLITNVPVVLFSLSVKCD